MKYQVHIYAGRDSCISTQEFETVEEALAHIDTNLVEDGEDYELGQFQYKLFSAEYLEPTLSELKFKTISKSVLK